MFDDSDRMIQWISYKSDGSISWKTIYKYDDKENITIEIVTVPESLPSKSIYKCDNNGNEIESTSYKPDGSINSKRLSLYDAKGNKLEEIIYSSKSGKPESKIVYEYK